MKNILKIIFLCIFWMTIFAVSAFAIDVYIDGVKVEFDSSTGFPFIKDSRTMVPLRATMESFGATVDWESDTYTAVVRKGTTTVRCKVGEYIAYRNNVKIVNDAATIIKDNRTYLPIRIVLESFGAEVEWDGDVIVTSPGAGDIIHKVEKTPSVTTNYWHIWNDALELMENKDYSGAVDKILSISCEFIKDNKGASSAMLYKRLGECYSHLGNYDKASACFKREAYYWSITPGQHESNIDANRRSELIRTNTQVYIKNTLPNMGAKTYFGAPLEPKGGICIGAYAEGDKKIYDPWDSSKFYMDTFPELVGKEMSSYLIYLSYGMSLSKYESHFKKAVKKGKVMQIAFEPMDGVDDIFLNDQAVIKLAKDMEKHECDFMLRFGGEMNDPTSKWYEPDPQVFIEKFRIIADIFHKHAPSVPVIWAPNHYPPDTIDDYYPGDEYVDYVGMSSYKMHSPITDPLGEGVDRSRWSNQLDHIYSLYGHKKPIIVVEGGASCMDYNTGEDVTPYASYQIKDFYTYLPIKYPNVKYCFIFDADRERQKFMLSTRPQYLEAYQDGLNSSDLYNTSAYKDYSYKYDYYEIGNNIDVKSGPSELCAYITEPQNNISYVAYYVNDIKLGVSYSAPYKVKVDLSKYVGSIVKITVKSFNILNKELTNYSVKVAVT